MHTEEEIAKSVDQLLLDEQGLIRILPANEIRSKLHQDILRLWLHYRAVYCLPTAELIEWLRQQIGNFPAIEIGAGNGAIGRALGIPRTDSHIQESAVFKKYYASKEQPTITYPSDIIKLEAQKAVLKFKPHTVVAAWLTQLVTRADEITIPGCCAGANEITLLRKVRRYIFIGNRRIHREKKIFNRVHEEYHFPFLISRGDPDLDRVWIFKGSGLR